MREFMNKKQKKSHLLSYRLGSFKTQIRKFNHWRKIPLAKNADSTSRMHGKLRKITEHLSRPNVLVFWNIWHWNITCKPHIELIKIQCQVGSEAEHLFLFYFCYFFLLRFFFSSLSWVSGSVMWGKQPTHRRSDRWVAVWDETPPSTGVSLVSLFFICLFLVGCIELSQNFQNWSSADWNYLSFHYTAGNPTENLLLADWISSIMCH